MAGEALLPALAIADLVTMRKAVAISVDAALAVRKGGHPPRPGGFIAVFAGAFVSAVVGKTCLRNPSDFAVVLFMIRRFACDPLLDFFAGIKNGFKISTGIARFLRTEDCTHRSRCI